LTGEKTCPDDCCTYYPWYGVADGGAVALPSGTHATLALLATAISDDNDQPTGKGVGLVRSVDPDWEDSGFELVSLGIGGYGPVRDLEGVRELDGIALVNGQGPVPFVVRVADVGPDGGGKDTVAIALGDAAGGTNTGVNYAAEGVLASGDLVGTWTLPVASGLATLVP
jgi:hypothetical protein